VGKKSIAVTGERMICPEGIVLGSDSTIIGSEDNESIVVHIRSLEGVHNPPDGHVHFLHDISVQPASALARVVIPEKKRHVSIGRGKHMSCMCNELE
jgi:hypothetical protein